MCVHPIIGNVHVLCNNICPSIYCLSVCLSIFQSISLSMFTVPKVRVSARTPEEHVCRASRRRPGLEWRSRTARWKGALGAPSAGPLPHPRAQELSPGGENRASLGCSFEERRRRQCVLALPSRSLRGNTSSEAPLPFSLSCSPSTSSESIICAPDVFLKHYRPF